MVLLLKIAAKDRVSAISGAVDRGDPVEGGLTVVASLPLVGKISHRVDLVRGLVQLAWLDRWHIVQRICLVGWFIAWTSKSGCRRSKRRFGWGFRTSMCCG